MTEAQYEVLGVSVLKRRVPPETIDGWLRGWKKEIISIVPIGTGAFLSFDSRHFVPAYFRKVPSGHTPKSDQPRQGRSKRSLAALYAAHESKQIDRLQNTSAPYIH
jgi:hypothetical protein